MYVCVYVCMCVFMYVCMYVCMYLCMYVSRAAVRTRGRTAVLDCVPPAVNCALYIATHFQNCACKLPAAEFHTFGRLITTQSTTAHKAMHDSSNTRRRDRPAWNAWQSGMPCENAKRSIQALVPAVQAFLRSGPLVVFLCGVPAFVAFRAFPALRAFRAFRSDVGVFAWRCWRPQQHPRAHCKTRLKIPLLTDINQSSPVCAQAR